MKIYRVRRKLPEYTLYEGCPWDDVGCEVLRNGIPFIEDIPYYDGCRYLKLARWSDWMGDYPPTHRSPVRRGRYARSILWQ